MILGIEPSNALLNTSLPCTHRTKATGRAATHRPHLILGEGDLSKEAQTLCTLPGFRHCITFVVSLWDSFGGCAWQQGMMFGVYVDSCGPTWGGKRASAVPEVMLAAQKLVPGQDSKA